MRNACLLTITSSDATFIYGVSPWTRAYCLLPRLSGSSIGQKLHERAASCEQSTGADTSSAELLSE